MTMTGYSLGDLFPETFDDDAASQQVHGVAFDSREVGAGDLFVALRDVRDGHDFVADALARGAAALTEFWATLD